MSDSTRADRMAAALRGAFAPEYLEVIDDSSRHAGHAGAQPGGETHYTIRLVSPAFVNLSRVARSRAVHQILEREFLGGLHALSLELRSPTEVMSKNS